MKRSLFLIGTCLVLIFFYACKKERNDPPDKNNVQYTHTDVQVILPEGTSMNFSGAKIITLAGSADVGADGKASVPFLIGGAQLAFLFDESDNLILESYITSDNKELSVKSTAQALLFQGLQFLFLPDSVKLDFLKKSAVSPKLTDYYVKMEQLFKADKLMLEKRSFDPALSETLSKLTDQNPISIYGKQIHIVDEGQKSKLEMEEVDVENINILHHAYRRTHAFVYKTAYKNQQGLETVLMSAIDYDDASEKDLKVEKIRYLTNGYDMINVAQGFKTATTGPVHLPVASNEKEATYKIRILGPGKPVGSSLTNAEKAKLDELYYQYLAYDILAPLMLDALGYKSLISSINEEALKPFAEKVKIIAQNETSVMESLKAGSVHGTITKFFDAVAASGQSNTLLSSSLLECMKAGLDNSNIPFPSAENLQNYEKQMNKGIELLKYATGVVSGPFILAPHEYYNEMEEFEVKSRDNNVKITPKESSVSTYVNHPLSAKANVELGSNQTMVYKWSTTGKYGGIKATTQGQAASTVETNQPSIYYFSNASSGQLGDDNIETVYVTAYIKEGSTLTEVGSDTATVNVKKNKLVMRPDDAEINLANGGSKSIMLYIVKSDGTRDILPNPVIDYKIVWSTAGSYGRLSNSSTSITTYDDNNVIYTAFDDDDITKVTENITAKVYFKTKAETSWTLREEVKGKVVIENDKKKIIYYTSPTSIHSDRNGNGCAVGCAVIVPPVKDAASYAVEVTGIDSKLYPTYSDSWPATDLDYVRGYAGYVYTSNAEAKGKYIVGVYGTFSWAGGAGTEHFATPSCTGTAKVTIILK